MSDNNKNNSVENDNIILIDENGEEIEFECLDILELNDKNYVVLIEAAVDEELADEGEIVILEMIEENGENVFLTIEDDKELDLVFAEFKQRYDDDEMDISESD